MKIIFTLAIALLFAGSIQAQDNATEERTELNLVNEEDFKKSEDFVLKCCDIILSSPTDKKDDERNVVNAFLIQWMTGTPDHTFTLDQTMMDLTDSDADLMTIFFASLVKATLSEENQGKSAEEINDITIDLYVDYCANSKNKVKKTKAVKKIIKERK